MARSLLNRVNTHSSQPDSADRERDRVRQQLLSQHYPEKVLHFVQKLPSQMKPQQRHKVHLPFFGAWSFVLARKLRRLDIELVHTKWPPLDIRYSNTHHMLQP